MQRYVTRIIKYSSYSFVALLVSFLGFVGIPSGASVQKGSGYKVEKSPLSLIQTDVCYAGDIGGGGGDGDFGGDDGDTC